MKTLTNVLMTFVRNMLKLLLDSKLLLIFVEQGHVIDVHGWKNN
jgi:hypothetical protein